MTEKKLFLQKMCAMGALSIFLLSFFLSVAFTYAYVPYVPATKRRIYSKTTLRIPIVFKQKIASTLARSLPQSALKAVALTEAQLARLERERAEHVPDAKAMALIRLLIDFWHEISFPPNGTQLSEDLDEKVSILRLPDYSLTRDDVRGFLKHFQSCKDCGADNVFLMASQEDCKVKGKEGVKVDALRLTHVEYSLLSESEDDYDALGG